MNPLKLLMGKSHDFRYVFAKLGQTLVITAIVISAATVRGDPLPGSRLPNTGFTATGTVAAGGDDIASATVIPFLPFNDLGSTVSYADDYDEDCVGYVGNAPDVVYSYTPLQMERVDISLCNSGYMTHLWVYENDPSTIVACNRFSMNCSIPRSAVENVLLTPGNTYYIVVDGENGASGDYEIDVELTTIRIEVDYMVGTDHSHELLQPEVDALVNMFACQGIQLEIDVSDAIPHEDVIGHHDLAFFTDPTPNTGYGWIKDTYFDHAGETGWHYCLMVHMYYYPGYGVTTSSGLGEINGDDFIVSLGAFINETGTPYERAGTFAHELGHNLGLRHAGDQDENSIRQFKPNYASIMAYRYQLDGVRQQMVCQGLSDTCSPFSHLDYSHGMLAALDESALDETIGIGFGPVDWNCNGVIDVGLVTADLSSDYALCSGGSSYQVITDYDDWSNIVDAAKSANREKLRDVEIVSCLTADEHAEHSSLRGAGCNSPPVTVEPCTYPYTDSDGDGIGDICDPCPASIVADFDGDGICSDVDNCPEMPNPDQADVNLNGIGDACECPAAWKTYYGEAGDKLGWRIDNAGDVDNDGYDDVITGLDDNSLVGEYAGAAHVYSGRTGETLFVFLAEAAGDDLGRSVSGAGDVNSDGYDDVIVGAPQSDANGELSGRAYVFYGGPGPFPDTVGAASADLILDGPGAGEAFGWEVDGLGDVGSDTPGPDLIVGAGHGGLEGYGAAYVYSGQTGDLLYSYVGEHANAILGYAIAPAGDFNNDGTDDYLIGSPRYDGGSGVGQGRVHLYSGVDGSVMLTITGEAVPDYFGGEVSSAGDINGDGYGDVIVGAPYSSAVAWYGGRAYVFHGGPGPFPESRDAASADLIIDGVDLCGFLGWSVSYTHDLDGDLVNELLVACPFSQPGWSPVGLGRVYVYSGQSGERIATITSRTGFDWFGRNICGSEGSLAANTFDLLVSAFSNDENGDGAGAAFVYMIGDGDDDGVLSNCDNCPLVANPGQEDANLDGVGDACCCADRGDADLSGAINVTDLTFLVAYLFQSGLAPGCPSQSDVDSSGQTNVSDLTYLVAYLFQSGPEPVPCE